MSSGDSVSPGDALVRLGEAGAAAIVASLAELGVDDVESGAIRAADDAGSAVDGFQLPVQATTVAGVSRTTFVLTQPGAARLAASTAAEGRTADIGAIGETLGTLVSAAAAAIEIGGDGLPAPRTRLVTEPDPAETWEAGATVAIAALTVCGEPAALVLVVPAELLEQIDDGTPLAAGVDVGPKACG